MLDDLTEPKSRYFDACRRIIWHRLSYGKLYELYNDGARLALARIWEGALARALGRPGGEAGFVCPKSVLDDAIQGDDDEWRRLASAVEASVDMPRAIDDFFLGVDERVVAGALRDGAYDR